MNMMHNKFLRKVLVLNSYIVEAMWARGRASKREERKHVNNLMGHLWRASSRTTDGSDDEVSNKNMHKTLPTGKPSLVIRDPLILSSVQGNGRTKSCRRVEDHDAVAAWHTTFAINSKTFTYFVGQCHRSGTTYGNQGHWYYMTESSLFQWSSSGQGGAAKVIVG